MTITSNTFTKVFVALIVAMIATAEPAFAQQAFTETAGFLEDFKDFIANNVFPTVGFISCLIGLGIAFAGNFKAGAIWFLVSLLVLVIGSAVPGTVNALY